MPVPVNPDNPHVAVPGKRSKYLPQLDGLRGVAILTVLLHHFHVHLPAWVDWGPIGVRLFFLLSGYLITLSLWKMNARAVAGASWWRGLWEYHQRRLTRLAPVLYLMLAIGFLLGLPEYRNAIVWHALFLTNFYVTFRNEWPGAASHLWSLSVQEQFYVLWPFVILVIPRRVLPWAMLALIGSALGFRFWASATNASDFLKWTMLPGVIDSFALGALIACWKASPDRLPLATGRLGYGVAAVALTCYVIARFMRYAPFESPFFALTETFENVFLGWLMLRTIEGWPGLIGRFFENRLLVYIGKVSYGIYVFHVLVHVLVGPLLDEIGLRPHVFARALVLSAVSIGVATLSWRFLENPLTVWVRRREAEKRGTSSETSKVAAE
jgi:peptidoglycan/LPS O-acetylase OafA/YrhL